MILSNPTSNSIIQYTLKQLKKEFESFIEREEYTYGTLSNQDKNLCVFAVGPKQIAAVSGARSAAKNTTRAYIVELA